MNPGAPRIRGGPTTNPAQGGLFRRAVQPVRVAVEEKNIAWLTADCSCASE